MDKEILKHQLRLELCRRDFWEFCKYYDSKFFNENKWHLKKIANAFQRVFEGELKKLAVSLPPRGGKSYITSLFCAWCLGRNPKGSIMRNSYAAKLAEKFSKDIRDGIIISPKFLEVFPDVRLGKSTAIDGWSLEGNTQPSYFCAGVGGAITGFGCNMLAILDDPLKNFEEAISEITIENVWNWYTSTHLSRLETGCPEIHIATRWSTKDPIGRLTDEGSEAYLSDMEVICIPALIDGESFCPEIKTTEEFLKIRKVTDSLIWEAEFMQQPVNEKGQLFPLKELNRFKMSEIATKVPDGVVGVTDTADSGKDFLCSISARVYGQDFYITDVVFSQDGVEITEPLVAAMIIKTKVQSETIESNNGGFQYVRNIKNLIRGRSTCTVIPKRTTANKETRILMNSGYVKEHVYFRSDYEEGSDYDKFLRSFTSYVKLGKNAHDDSVDAVTMLIENYSLRKFGEPEKKYFDEEANKEYDSPYHQMVSNITGGVINDEMFDWRNW